MSDIRRPSGTFPLSPSGKEHVVPELGEYVIANKRLMEGASDDEFNRLLTSIKLASKSVNREIKKYSINESIHDRLHPINLDTYAKDKFVQAMQKRQVVCGILTPGKKKQIIQVNPNASFIFIISPLEDSQLVHCNIPSGTIFSIYRRISPTGSPPTTQDFLQPGRKILCAGYLVYGPCTQLILSAGSGVQCFTLDPSIGTFFLSHPSIFFPLEDKGDYSVEEGSFKKFSPGVQKAIEWLRSEVKSEGKKPFACRFIGALVSDFHRNLFHGGVYFRPREEGIEEGGHDDGVLHSEAAGLRSGHSLVFQCAPLAFIAVQAGGMATDGEKDVLQLIPRELGHSTPFLVGQEGIVRKMQEIMMSYEH